MRNFMWGIIGFCVFGITTLGQEHCHAQLIAGDNFALLAQSGGSLLLNGGIGIGPTGLAGTYVIGNVGIGTGAQVLASGGTIQGNLTFVDSQATVASNNYYSPTGSFNVTGSVNYGDPGFSVTNALSSAEKDSSTIGGYTATQTFNGISLQPGQTKTIVGVSGVNVININGDLNIFNGELTFSGPANAVFYVNISGQVSIDGGISQALNGQNVTVAIASTNPGNVLLNMTGDSEFFGIDGGSLVEGSVLNVNGSSEIGIFDSAVEGQVVGDTIDISDGQILTPEGSSLPMVMFGMLPIMIAVFRRRSHAGATA